MSAICFLPERHCGTYQACLCFLVFLFLSFYYNNIFSVGLEHACALVVVYSSFYFLLYFVSLCTITGPILRVFSALIVHSELKSVHPGFPVAFIFKHKLINK